MILFIGQRMENERAQNHFGRNEGCPVSAA